MTTQAIGAVWSEPRATGAEGPRARDWALVALIVVVASVETALRDELVWRAASLVFAVLTAGVLPWRRVRPLAATAVAVGMAIALSMAALASDVRWEGLHAAVVMLLLPYSLGRWGSGREIVGGAGIFSVILSLSAIAGDPLADIVGGAVIVVLAGAVGAGVRYRQLAHRQELDSVRSRERADLARELHDTVAHHVSAIAVQAQAGRALAGTDVDALGEILEVIEEQASRTLEEMRSMVGALRDGARADLAPPQGVHDIERLARADGPGPRVSVQLTGPLRDLRPSLDAALYRLAQEAITNARRHAQHATHVTVRVEAADECVQLSVDDDGRDGHTRPAPGFGLAGMAERAKLLGGTFSAGPRPDGGWNVTAVLPRTGLTR
jgi:signal transduction histidine kinase